jgi:hypothetical protein
MPISDELKAVYATAPVDRYYVETLELRHPGLPTGARFITNQKDGWTGTLEDTITIETFEYVPFAVIPPKSAEDSALSLQVAIDNASRSLMENLELLAKTPTEPIVIFYRVYLSDDSTVVQNDPPLQLDIMTVTATNHLISFNAGMTNLRTRPFPATLYTTVMYPGLAR